MPERNLTELKKLIERIRLQTNRLIEENTALKLRIAILTAHPPHNPKTIAEAEEEAWKEYEEWLAKRGL